MINTTERRRWIAAAGTLSAALVVLSGICVRQAVRLRAYAAESMDLQMRLQAIQQREDETGRTRLEFRAALDAIGPIPLAAGVTTTYHRHRETDPFHLGFPEGDDVTGGGGGHHVLPAGRASRGWQPPRTESARFGQPHHRTGRGSRPHRIACRQRLGGMLRYYYRDAA